MSPKSAKFLTVAGGVTPTSSKGDKNKATTALRTGGTRSGHPRIGTCYLHTVIDDHFRVAHAEICADEKDVTAIGVLHGAVAWIADHGVTVDWVLSDNGSAHRSHAWHDACAQRGIAHKQTRPYGPQTNGKICEDLGLALHRSGLTPSEV